MTRRDPAPEKGSSRKEPYRSPRIREYGTIRKITRNAFNFNAGDSPAFFDQAS